MQVIFEVRIESNRKEKLYPVEVKSNNITAANRCRDLNKRLEKNRLIFEGLYQVLRNHHNGDLNKFTPQERKQFESLEQIQSIKEYTHEFVNDKRVERYNPMQADKLVPDLAPKEKKSSGKKKEETPKTSKSALKILKDAGLKESDVKGTGQGGLITVEDAKKAATASKKK